MIYAVAIHMCYGCEVSNNLLEIESIYVESNGAISVYKKSDLYDFLIKYPRTVKVNVSPYPDVIPCLSVNYEKYVKSTPNAYQRDNLLSLPRK